MLMNFKNNGYEYGLDYKDGKYFYYKKLDGCNIPVSFGDKKFINDVYKRVIPHGKSICLANFSWGKKQFVHYFFPINGFHTFYEIVGNNVKIPENNDLVYLNNLFNNQEEKAYLSLLKNNEASDYIKRIVKIGNKLIIVLLASSVVFSFSSSSKIDDYEEFKENDEIYIATEEDKLIKVIENGENVIDDNELGEVSIIEKEPVSDTNELSKENTTDENIVFEENQDVVGEKVLTVPLIADIIQNNPNLSDKEKQLFLSNLNVYEDNLEYLDYDNVVENFSNLKVIYDPEKSLDYIGTLQIMGEDKGLITCYGTGSFDDADKSILLHEFCHALTNYNTDEYFSNKFLEIVNSIFVDEYFADIYANGNEFDYGYSINKCYVQALCEIIDPQVIKEYHANPNDKLIINELLKIIPDEEMAYQLINDINLVNNYTQLARPIKVDEACDRIIESLESYYQAKYNMNAKNNLNMLLYLYPDEFYNSVADSIGIDAEFLNQINPLIEKVQIKSYFNTSINRCNVININTDAVLITNYYDLDYMLGLEYVVYENGEYVLFNDNYIKMDDNTYARTKYQVTDKINYEVPQNGLIDYLENSR